MPEYGELFILVSARGKRTLRRRVEGQDIHCTDGLIPASALAEVGFRGEVPMPPGLPFRALKPPPLDPCP